MDFEVMKKARELSQQYDEICKTVDQAETARRRIREKDRETFDLDIGSWESIDDISKNMVLDAIDMICSKLMAERDSIKKEIDEL